MVDIAVTHAYTTTQGDPPPSQAALVGQSRWNAAHVIQVSDVGLVGRSDSGIGPATGIIVGAGLLLAAATLSVGANIQQGADIDPGVNVITINMPDSSLYGPFTLVGHSRVGGPDGRLQSQAAWGFNVGPNCYPLIPNQPAMRMAMANHFNSTSDPLTASMEMNFGFFKPTADIEFIPCFAVDYSYNAVGPFSGNHPETAWNLSGDRINFTNTEQGNLHLAILSNGPNSTDGAVYSFGVGSSMSFNKNGVPVGRQINVAGNAYLNLPYIDSANRLAIEQAAVINGMLVYAPVGSGAGQNTFVGANVGGFLTLTTAHGNTAVGWSALGALTTGTLNTAIGLVALAAIQDGGGNIGIGSSALQSLVSGGACIGIGGSVLLNYVGAGPNVAIGFASLFELTTGINNAAYGYNSGRGITTGSANTILGSNVTGLAATLSNSIILADGAGNIRADYNKSTAGDWTLVGDLNLAATLRLPDTTSANVGVMYLGNAYVLHDFHNNFFVGPNAGNFTLTGTGNFAAGSLVLSALTSGNDNCGFGYGALSALKSGLSNTAAGGSALAGEQTGTGNTVAGFNAALSQNGASANTIFGYLSGGDITTGSTNLFIGVNTGRGITTGQQNTIIGGNVSLPAATSNVIVIADGAGNIRLDYGLTAAGTWVAAVNSLRVTAGGSGPTYALNNTVTSRFANMSLANGFLALLCLGADDIILGVNNDVTTKALRLFASDGHITMAAGVASTSTTTGTLVVTGGLGVSGNLFGASAHFSTGLAIGAALDPNYLIYANANAVDPTSFTYAISGVRGLQLSANNANPITGFGGTAAFITGAFTLSGQLTGVFGLASIGATGGTASLAVGLQGQVYNTVAATVSLAYGVLSNVQNLNASGVITDFRAFYVGTGFNLGILTTWYGLYIDTPPTAATKWGVFVNGAINNQMGTGLTAFGGGTSSFPALKRSGTTIQVRLADDSDWAPLGTGKITANDATSASLTANCTTAGQQSLHVMQDAGTNIWAVLKNTDNSFNIFDYVNGVNCFSISNGTKIIGFAYQTVFGAGTTTRSPIHMNSGVAPASPNNGDIWFDGTNLKMQLGGVTKTFTLT